jgi:hypothetical protein
MGGSRNEKLRPTGSVAEKKSPTQALYHPLPSESLSPSDLVELGLLANLREFVLAVTMNE